MPHEPNLTLSVPLDLTPNEFLAVVHAIRGDFPPELDKYRLGLLRKLTRAQVRADLASESESVAA